MDFRKQEEIMWSLEILKVLNGLAHEQAIAGKPEKDALLLLTDPRKKEPVKRQLHVANGEPCLPRGSQLWRYR